MKRKSYQIISGLLILVITFGCTSKEMKKAKEFMDASMYEQAISLLEIEIQANPKNAEASYLLGKCYLETSNHNKVEDCFKRAILLDTDLKESIGNIYFDKSLDLYKKSDFRYANSYYEEGLKYNPTYKDDFANKLFDYTSEFSETTSETDNTIQLLSTIDHISPNYKSKIADLTYSLAKSFIEKGFIKEGFEYADYGIKYDSKHIKDVAELYYNHANDLLTVQNKPNGCISYFERCIVLNPEKKIEIGNIFYNQAKTYETNNEINLLLLFAKKSSEINTNYKSWYLEIKEKYKPKVPTEGLVAYYPFNGNTNDEGGTNNSGRINGSIFTKDRHGNNNSAVYFDGNNYINFGHDPVATSSDVTFCAWFNCTERMRNHRGYLISSGGQTGSSTGYYLAVFSSRIGAGRSNMKHSIGGDSFYVQPNTWYFACGVYNSNTGKVSVYINGKLDTEHTSRIGRQNQSYRNLMIGKPNNANKSYFSGTIDDIRIYNRALSSEEIFQIYNEI